jgi:hypothetical protein
MNDTLLIIIFSILFLILSLIVPYGILIYAIKYIRKRGFLTSESEKTLLKFIKLFVAIDLIMSIYSSFYRFLPSIPFISPFILNLSNSPLQFIQSTLPTVVALWLVLRILPLSSSLNTTTLIDDAYTLKNAVDKLLNSENFLTAIRTTLPKGERDSEYGTGLYPIHASQH